MNQYFSQTRRSIFSSSVNVETCCIQNVHTVRLFSRRLDFFLLQVIVCEILFCLARAKIVHRIYLTWSNCAIKIQSVSVISTEYSLIVCIRFRFSGLTCCIAGSSQSSISNLRVIIFQFVGLDPFW